MQSSCHGKAALSGLVLLLITSYNIDSADGLSDSICNNIEAEWQTDEPRLNGAFPFYTLLGKLFRLCCYQVYSYFKEVKFPSLSMLMCSVLYGKSDAGRLQCGLLRQQWSRLWAASSRRILQLLGCDSQHQAAAPCVGSGHPVSPAIT